MKKLIKYSFTIILVTIFQNYLAIEDLGGPSWHPNRNKITFVYNAPGVYQVYSVDIVEDQSLWPLKLTYNKNRCTNPKYLDDGSIAFVKDEGGDENFQIGNIGPRGSINWITKDLNAKHNLNYATKQYLYYTSNTKDKSKFAVYRHKLPLNEHEPEKLYTPKNGLIAVQLVNTDDTLLVFTNYFSNTHSDILVYNVTNGKINNLTEKLNQQSASNWVPIRFIDDNTLLVNSNFENDFKRPVKINLSGDYSVYTDIETDFNLDFVSFEFKSSSPKTYCVVNDDGFSRLYEMEFSPSEIKYKLLILPGKGVVVSGDQRSYTSAMSLNHDGSLLAITYSQSDNPTNIFIINLQTGSSWQCTQTSTPGIHQHDFRKATLHRFNSFDGLEVPYFKYIPKSTRPDNGWPTLMMIHGGPEAQFKPSFFAVGQAFLSQNFAIIAPNIRGSAGYGRNYMDLDNKEKRLDSILDIKHLALYLQSDQDIDTDNLIIYGGSYGGFAVLSAMTEHPELWRAGVDIVGISDFVTFLKNTAAWRRKLRESEYGSLEEDLKMLQQISPIHKIDRIQAPIFIIQGDNDERVPLSESIQMHQKLLDRGLQTRLLRFSDEGHGVVKLKNKIIAYSEIMDWLKQIIN